MMAALYLDENFTLAVDQELRQHGHSVTNAVVERRLGASDPHQLLYAADMGWTIVTHNRDDFRWLHDAWLLWSHRWGTSQSHAGILVLEQYFRQTPSDIVRALTSLLEDSAVSLGSALYEWKRSIGWVRFPGYVSIDAANQVHFLITG